MPAQKRPTAPLRRRRSVEGRGGLVGLLTPGTLWLVLFFLLPLVFVAVSSFMSRGPGGQPVQPLTLDQYERTFTTFAPILWRSLRIALVATLFCLVLGSPVAFFISRRRSPGVRMMLLFLVLLPFWTNFLVRTYALITILQRDGLLNGLLQSLGVLAEPIQMVLTPYGVQGAYEKLKEVTRGKTVTAEALHALIHGLDIPHADKDRLLAMTPASYMGKAAELARRV